MIVIEIPGPPRGKGRPRSRIVTPRGKPQFISVYTDAETRNYETAIAILGKVAMRSKSPLIGPLSLRVTAFFGVPKSWPSKRRDAALAGTVRPTGKPDWDNIGKTTDGLKGIVFVDDSQIVEALVIKRYSERSRLRIEIEPVKEFFASAGETENIGEKCPSSVSDAL